MPAVQKLQLPSCIYNRTEKNQDFWHNYMQLIEIKI